MREERQEGKGKEKTSRGSQARDGDADEQFPFEFTSSIDGESSLQKQPKNNRRGQFRPSRARKRRATT